MPGNAELLIGIGDDAALVRAPDGRVAAATDLLIEGRHFRRDWSSASDIGAKAAARSLADIAAMGARPTALLIGLAAPPDLGLDWALALARGLAEESAAAGACVAGGDTSSADTIMLAVTALGDLAGREAVRRGGARPGDIVAVAGVLGWSAAGQALLAAGLRPAPAGGSAEPGRRVGRPPARPEPGEAGQAGLGAAGPELSELIRWHRRPRPSYAAGPQAGTLGATAMIDVSDGLLADLGHVAAASDVRIEVSSAALAAGPARSAALRQAAAWLDDARLGPANWLDWVLGGGEDHALTATFPAGTVLPKCWPVVGTVSSGAGVSVDGDSRADLMGWDHFGVSRRDNSQ